MTTLNDMQAELAALAEQMQKVADKMVTWRGPHRNTIAVHGFQLQGAEEMVRTWAKGIKP